MASVVVVAFAVPHASAPTACDELVPPGRVRHVNLPGRGFDVVVLPGGDYAVATSVGVIALDPCDLMEQARCDDLGEARRIHEVQWSTVVYSRRDGTLEGCNLATGELGRDEAPVSRDEEQVTRDGKVATSSSARL